MTNDPTSRPTRWAGVSSEDRVRERRALLIDAGFDLFGTEGEVATSIRAVCRATELNARYFYENFAGPEELIGAVYDQQAELLGDLLVGAMDPTNTPRARMRAGIETVLRFITEDPRRAKVLFTEGRSIPALAQRRRAALEALVAATAEAGKVQLHPRLATMAAVMFGGAMEELVQSWTDGRLGADLEPVLDDAVALSLAMFEGAQGLGNASPTSG